MRSIDPVGNVAGVVHRHRYRPTPLIESNGIKLPYSCRAGVYSSCAGKLVSGTIQQDDQDFLDSDQVEAGYVLLCIAYPTSDCIIKANAEDEL
ncbi:hypothetical protein FGSG_11530 [Fusarium graminearum PH-1]|uniref:hypothetical protein n=1 Tax=Gibberella zeae (strain ATCC MYA-4620 / CBS 123657 / FGSC 9075 / NRRL 31084 / PH-1) TaxID=229533 RepID=UPI00021F22DB|nr:hypothetical protein FGSG_11530 [Fusarium graminearum PH-1]ESU08300.1 hypothetical protein FGSG_11530 [Fusarium graminearum PH-1]|eukprot:XP_011323096.1 hypothetical protein FGSG_11530 [Fusarium graminearum PH-1]